MKYKILIDDPLSYCRTYDAHVNPGRWKKGEVGEAEPCDSDKYSVKLRLPGSNGFVIGFLGKKIEIARVYYFYRDEVEPIRSAGPQTPVA